MNADKKYIDVINLETGAVEHQVDVTDKSERHIETCLRGMLRNLDREKFCLREPKP